LLADEIGSGVEAMMIAGVVTILFILGLFFEMLGSAPKTDAEWQIDTDREPVSTNIPVPTLDVTVPAPSA